MNDVFSSGVKHVVDGVQLLSVLVQNVGLIQEFLSHWIIATKNVEVSLGCHDISCVIGNVELVLNTDCLSHVVHDLVRIDELGAAIQIENSGKHALLEGIFELEVTREMLLEKFIESLIDFFRRSAICEREIIILSVNRKVLGDDIVEFVNHGGNSLNFIRIDYHFLFVLFLGFDLRLLFLFYRLFPFFIFFFLNIFLGFFIDFFLSFDLGFDIFQLLLEGLFEMWLELIKTLLHLIESVFLKLDPLIILVQMRNKVIEIIHLLLVLYLIHLVEYRVIFLLQGFLVDRQLLLTQNKRIVLVLNFFDQVAD